MKGKFYPNFIARFIILAAKCGKTAKQKIEALRQRVSDELATEITHRSNKPAKGDFEAWSKLYGAIYNDFQDEKHINQLRHGNDPFLRLPEHADCSKRYSYQRKR
jgi:hypothetical protein